MKTIEDIIRELNLKITALNMKKLKIEQENNEIKCSSYLPNFNKGKIEGMREAKKLLEEVKQLDEPQRPVVPQFVAEYLNYCIGNEWTLTEALNSSECIFPEDNLEKASVWLEDSMNQNIFAQAWLFGYEIEKDPLYEVVFLEDENDRYLLMELNEHFYEIVPESENDGYRKQYFTEKEIKTINERYWAFAVLVEEVAEG